MPTLYFAEGIPYFVVNNISVIMFTNMGMSKGLMAMYTSLLYLPWVVKPLWSPFIDIIKTKRWWILAMQVLVSIAFVALALTLPHPSQEVMAAGMNDISVFAVTLVIFWLTAFASATHDIAADGYYMLALNPGDRSWFVGIRSTFYRLSSIFGQGALVVIAGLLETGTGDVPLAWKITLLICAAIFGAISVWHMFRLPAPDADAERREGRTVRSIMHEFARTFMTFFRKPGILAALAFMLLYRLPEAFLVKMMNPFLLDPVSEGGLGLSTEMVGVVYGTVGVIALTLGGILGGMAASRWGLKKSLWPMALALTLPCMAFILLAWLQPQNLWVISSCIALDQFGYGFGFTSYMLYLMYFSEGEFKTAHYSLTTAFMALSMMLPGMAAGYMQESMGYVRFFAFVVVCSLVTFAVTFLLKVDPKYGKKEQ